MNSYSIAEKTVLKYFSPKNIKVLRNSLVFFLKLTRILMETVTQRSLIDNKGNLSLEIVQVEKYTNTFCGYYDVSPFNPSSSNYVLLHCTNQPVWKKPSTKKPIDIILHDRSSNISKYIDSTSTWNWQQGARLQWLDSENFVYNKYLDGVKCIMVNVRTGEKCLLPIGLSIAYKNKYVISIDYDALTSGSEYGYPGLIPEIGAHEIKCYDLQKGTTEILFSLIDLGYLLASNAYKAHINHILPSPNGERFVFMYRYWLNGVRFDSLIIFCFVEGKIQVKIDNQTISHYAWKCNEQLLFWGVLDEVAGYYLLNTNTDDITIIDNCDDGHPNFIDDNNFVTDIGVSIKKPTALTLYTNNIQTGKKIELLTLGHPAIFNMGNRCDLHVSLSADRKEFQVDSRHLPVRRSVIIGTI